ncbi:DNA glycosylase AlkZ-like family protein [Kutzneria kofuensis]|uniref:DNA glycosylase AlkZ-like family protein n=1 Tax=Kutzneria kofuensis TaxID=103725 RepID=UPI003CD0A1F0
MSDRDAAVRALVARYRAAHDPSEPEDLAQWSGLPLGEIRAAWGGDSTVEGEPGDGCGCCRRTTSTCWDGGRGTPVIGPPAA